MYIVTSYNLPALCVSACKPQGGIPMQPIRVVWTLKIKNLCQTAINACCNLKYKTCNLQLNTLNIRQKHKFTPKDDYSLGETCKSFVKTQKPALKREVLHAEM